MRVLDNFSTGNRRNLATSSRTLEVVEGELRSYERVHNAMRGVEVVFHQGALAVGAALGAGPADDERRQRRGHAQRPARGARRGRPARRLRVVVVGLRQHAGRCRAPRRSAGPALAVRASRSSRPSATASSFARVYGLETVALRYFNVFGPRQDPHSQYAAVVPLFIAAVDAASRSRSTATASSRATSRTSTTSSTRTSGQPTRPRPPATSSTSPTGAAARASTRSPTRSATCSASRSRRSTCPPRTGDVRDSWADVAEARARCSAGSRRSGSRTGCA